MPKDLHKKDKKYKKKIRSCVVNCDFKFGHYLNIVYRINTIIRF